MKDLIVTAAMGAVLGTLFGFTLRLSVENAEQLEKEAERMRRENDKAESAA